MNDPIIIAIGVVAGWLMSLGAFWLLRPDDPAPSLKKPEPRKPKEYDDDDATELASDAADTDAKYRAAVARAKRERAELQRRLRAELWGDGEEPGRDDESGKGVRRPAGQGTAARGEEPD